MVDFPKLGQPLIIATKGLPCTGKSEIARCISGWAVCPVLSIDHFLDALSFEKGYTADSLPSPDEAERLHRLSFDVLCKAASDYLRWGVDSLFTGERCVVIKSRLCSTFELDRLVQLGRERGCRMILIIEFQMKNQHRMRRRLDHKVELGERKEWYKPKSWIDIEKAREDYDCLAAQVDNWEDHLLRLLENGDETDGLPQVIKLVLDPFDDLYLDPPPFLSILSQVIIKQLVQRLEVGDQDSDEEDLLLAGRYEVVQCGEFGRYLREKELRDALYRERDKYPCNATNGTNHCVFKFWEELQAIGDEDESNSYYCGVCEELVVSGQAAYSCHFCTLTLHKLCAEMPTSVAIEGFEDIKTLRLYPNFGGESPPQKDACKSCIEGGKAFSDRCFSCNFQMHLKCRVLPTVLNHECHEHFIFMLFGNAHKCKACGTDREFGGSYGCYICFMSYDIECLSLVRQVEHEHGGHQHLLKLTYSRDGMEKEESYWCDICYEDIDPQNWFYSCQHCPYYGAHPHCVRRTN